MPAVCALIQSRVPAIPDCRVDSFRKAWQNILQQGKDNDGSRCRNNNRAADDTRR